MKRSILAGKVCHKDMEKRRREKINSCISELSRLVPECQESQHTSRKDKSDILESTVKYLKLCQKMKLEGMRETERSFQMSGATDGRWISPLCQRYVIGYQECAREVLRYLSEVAGLHFSNPKFRAIDQYLRYRTMEVTKVIVGHSDRHDYQYVNHSPLPIVVHPVRAESTPRCFCSTCLHQILNSSTRSSNNVVTSQVSQFL